MKRFYTSLLGLLMTISLAAADVQGWPANYGGVMLQGFYWDSFSDTKWTNLESQASELAQYFNLIWVPQSGYCNSLTNQMGYSDIWWFDQKSCFGTAAELKSMISTFKDKGLLTIADVVINHKNGNTNWCDFPTETWNGQTMTWSLADICQTDEAKAKGYAVTGNADTGDDFNGCRDLDHTSANVQKNIKLYLQFLQEEMGYAGFRYDMTGGYAPAYTKIYNESATPEFSVGEYWKNDGLTGLQGWIDGTGMTSAAFDFQLKWLINNAFNNSSWSQLANLSTQSLIGSGYNRYAVTFVDNHDTGRDSGNMLKANVEAANAYILTMPGTPCVWLTHWQGFKTQIKKLITARKLAGINNQSKIITNNGSSEGYYVRVRGTKGDLMLVLGNIAPQMSGFKLATEGTNYKLYISESIDISDIENIEDDTFIAPSFCTWDDNETCAFFEAPSTWTAPIRCWAWNSSLNYTDGNWNTSTTCTLVGTADNGNKVYKWTWNGKCYNNGKTTETTPQGSPTGIIFHNSSQQTADFDFTNGGYYNYSGKQGIVTGISNITIDENQQGKRTNNAIYNLAGQRVDKTYKGIVIKNGKKVVIK